MAMSDASNNLRTLPKWLQGQVGGNKPQSHNRPTGDDAASLTQPESMESELLEVEAPVQDADSPDSDRNGSGIEALMLSGLPPSPKRNDWQKTIGMFAGDADFERAYKAGLKYRQSQR